MRPDSGRATPADPSSNYIGKKSSKTDLRRSKKGHAYYNEAFAVREAGPQVPVGAGIMVELKTNVILENEFDFIKSLSQIVAKRYSRPEESVALSVSHSSCMIMGGTFEGCYFLTITSPVSISPTCNKRNVALISEWLNVHLGVPSSRGYIRFMEPDMANYAVGGMTCLDMMERERSSTRIGMTTTIDGFGGSSKNRSKISVTSKNKPSVGTDKLDESRSITTRGEDTLSEVLSFNSGRNTAQSDYAEKPVAAAVKRGRSMFNLFGRSQKIPAA
ncbi:Tautomerase/MIF superfamily [Kalaharituber pfeilii]|nr:Tautomerase/MIF superfamily [Kalaharituber pfeilii]